MKFQKNPLIPMLSLACYKFWTGWGNFQMNFSVAREGHWKSHFYFRQTNVYIFAGPETSKITVTWGSLNDSAKKHGVVPNKHFRMSRDHPWRRLGFFLVIRCFSLWDSKLMLINCLNRNSDEPKKR
jgi:hypothetical protein